MTRPPSVGYVAFEVAIGMRRAADDPVCAACFALAACATEMRPHTPRQSFNGNPPRLGSGMLGNRNLEHAVVPLGADTLRVRGVRQYETQVKAPKMALAPLPLRGTLLGSGDATLLAALTGKSQHPVVQVDLDGLGVHAWQVDQELESVLVFDDVDRRRPLSRRTVAIGVAEVAEDSVDLVL